MNKRIILQIPMSKELKEKAEQVSADYGFSSLQETVRVLLQKLSKRELTISVYEEKPEKLSLRAARRYAKMSEDIESGKVITYEAKDVDDLMDQLYDRKAPVPSKIHKKLQ